MQIYIFYNHYMCFNLEYYHIFNKLYINYLN